MHYITCISKKNDKYEKKLKWVKMTKITLNCEEARIPTVSTVLPKKWYLTNLSIY